MRTWPTILLAVVAGCYRPATERACHVVCGENGLCPEGFACNAAGLCATPDGCPIEPVDDALMIDAPPDAPPDTPPQGTICYGTTVEVCIPQPTTPLSIGTVTIATDGTSPMCTLVKTSTQDIVCAISGTTVTIVGNVRAEGPNPLVIVGDSRVHITGTIDVSEQQRALRGAGSPFGGCVTGAMATMFSGLDAGGGAGGSFGTGGGHGATVNTKANGGVPGAADTSTPVRARGGCDGQVGAIGMGAITAARAGRGGGAVYLIANGPIDLGSAGYVNASGGGAPISGTAGDIIGGGGGGSGGVISFDGTVLTLDGDVVANGGGGAAGTNGSMGGNPDPATPAVPASGGLDASGVVSGGNGAVGSNPGGDGAALSAGPGGGGGGGVGFILVRGTGGCTLCSPAPTTL